MLRSIMIQMRTLKLLLFLAFLLMPKGLVADDTDQFAPAAFPDFSALALKLPAAVKRDNPSLFGIDEAKECIENISALYLVGPGFVGFKDFNGVERTCAGYWQEQDAIIVSALCAQFLREGTWPAPDWVLPGFLLHEALGFCGCDDRNFAKSAAISFLYEKRDSASYLLQAGFWDGLGSCSVPAWVKSGGAVDSESFSVARAGTGNGGRKRRSKGGGSSGIAGGGDPLILDFKVLILERLFEVAPREKRVACLKEALQLPIEVNHAFDDDGLLNYVDNEVGLIMVNTIYRALGREHKRPIAGQIVNLILGYESGKLALLSCR